MSGVKKTTDQKTIDKIHKLNEQGYSTNEIAKIVGIKRRKVIDLRHSHPSSEWKDFNYKSLESLKKIDELIAARKNKPTLSQIAAYFKVNKPSIEKALKEIAIRDGKDKKPKKPKTKKYKSYEERMNKIKKHQEKYKTLRLKIGDVVNGGTITKEYENYYLVQMPSYTTTVHKYGHNLSGGK